MVELVCGCAITLWHCKYCCGGNSFRPCTDPIGHLQISSLVAFVVRRNCHKHHLGPLIALCQGTGFIYGTFDYGTCNDKGKGVHLHHICKKCGLLPPIEIPDSGGTGGKEERRAEPA